MRIIKPVLLATSLLLAANCDLAPEPSAPAHEVVLEFSGSYDPATDTFTITPLHSVDRAASQALAFDVPVEQDGTPQSSTQPDVVELNTVSTGADAAPCTSPPGEWCGSVDVQSFYTNVILEELWVEFTSINPPGAAATNSDAPGATGLSAANGGLWRYGDLNPGLGNRINRVWEFPTGIAFNFTGRVVSSQISQVHWRYDNIAGLPMIIDHSGHGVHGTGAGVAYAAPVVPPGQPPVVFPDPDWLFFPPGSSVISTVTTPALQGDYSVSFWFYISSLEEPPGPFYPLFCAQNAQPAWGTAIWYDPGIPGIVVPRLLYHHDSTFANGGAPSIFSGPALADDNWHHVLAVHNAGNILVYVDGVPGAPAGGLAPLAAPTTVVSGAIPPVPFSLYGLNGYIDDVRVYDWALSGGDAQTLAMGQWF